MVREEHDRAPLEVTDEELQNGLDAFRQKKKLLTADETEAWMLSHEQLEQQIENAVRFQKLAERLVGHEARIEWNWGSAEKLKVQKRSSQKDAA